jgi:predicted nucleic acid-binding protein
LIVSAAQVGGCKYLLTEDLQDGQDLDGLEVVDPFRRSPDTILG